MPQLVQAALAPDVYPELAGLLSSLEQRQDAVRLDASKKQVQDQVKKLLNKAARRVAKSITEASLLRTVQRYGKETDQFQKDQLSKQTSVGIGVSLNEIKTSERGVKSRVNAWIALNVNLIKSLPDVYFDDIQQRTFAAIDHGTRHETLAKDLASRYDIRLNQAKLIARDQVGKLYSDLNSQRQQNLGVNSYRWRTSNDNRVREEHARREGQEFPWNDSPSDGAPGFPINCRCYPEPVFKILEDD